MDALAWLLDGAHWHGAGSIPAQIGMHLLYTFAALGVAALIALPLGIYIGHTGRGERLIVGWANALRALPTFGLLILLVLFIAPLLSSNLAFVLPTLLVLVLLAVPPMAGFSPYLWLACTTFLIGAGTGAINPALRNAGLQLAPRRASSIAAIRSMFMATGGIITISLATAILAPASDPGGTQAWIYIGLAVILLVTLPTIRRVPEHHGAW